MSGIRWDLQSFGLNHPGSRYPHEDSETGRPWKFGSIAPNVGSNIHRQKKHLLYDFIDRKLKEMKSSVRTERSVFVWVSEVGQADRLTKGGEDALGMLLNCRGGFVGSGVPQTISNDKGQE